MEYYLTQRLYNLIRDKSSISYHQEDQNVVKVSNGRQSQVADGHLSRAQMANEAFRSRLKCPTWSDGF